MGLFGKRRRYGSMRRKRPRVPTFWDNLVWAVDPDTTREIIAVVLIIFGLVSLLGLLNLAGQFGEFFLNISQALWGDILSWLVPIVFLVLGVKLLITKKDYWRATSVVGIVLLFFLIPAMFGQAGGALGRSVASLFIGLLGNIAAYIVMAGAVVVSGLLALNASISTIAEKLHIGTPKLPGFKVNQGARVPVKSMEVGPMRTHSGALVAGNGTWNFPSIDLLEYSSGAKPDAGDVGKNVEIIKKTLKDFGIEVAMGDVNIGPTIAQYTLKPAEGVKLTNITSRSNDIALAIAAHPVRIEAPIPGKSLVGIEVPNKTSATVSLREVLEDVEYRNATSALSLGLGRDVAGEIRVADLKKMPHLLIAGSTGSGKSVCMNAVLINLLYRNSPADLRMILIDPKRVEFTEYNGIPHLLTSVITEVDKTISALRWLVSEMDRRYQLLASFNKRNIDAFNEAIPAGEQKMPYIIIVVDELADLMTQAANEVEGQIVRLAQMARAVGMHLIVATQRPSVDVITGLIKANITTRIAFAVASNADSRTILDMGGADKLLGKGDMLYMSSDNPQPRRLQGVFLKDKEIKQVTDFMKEQAPPVYDETITTYRTGLKDGGQMSQFASEGDDELFNEARELVIQAGKASASLLQRRLKVGYARAARLLDLMEQEGVIGPADGAKPREVLVGQDEYQGP